MKNVLITLMLFLPAFLLGQSGDSFQKNLVGLLAYNEQQVLQLGEAIPAEKFDWRPVEGVRSVGEALLHLAQANYFFLMNLGASLPEGVDLQTMDAIKGKEKVLETVKNSFAFVNEKIPGISDLDATVKFPFGEMNKQSALLVLLDHSGEHKGQLIAYARMNGIKPPWSE